MKSVKKFSLVFLILLWLTSCNSKIEKIEIKENKPEAKYNILTNGFANLLQMGEFETTPLYYAETNNLKYGTIIIPMYIEDNLVLSLNKNPSAICTVDDSNQCKAYIKSNSVYVYDNKVYYLDEKYNKDVNEYDCTLMQSELDLTNQKKLYSFKHVLNKEEMSDGWYTEFIQIHKGIIYVLYHDTLYIGNEENMLLPLDLPGIKGIKKIFLYEDKLEISADEYDDGKKVHFDTVVECSLLGELEDILYENMIVYFIDNNVVIYLNTNEMSVYMMNRKEKYNKKIVDGICTYYFKNKNYYLIDSISVNEKPKLMLIDSTGNVLDEKYIENEMEHTPQLFTMNRLYFKQKNKVGYFKITNGKISNDYYIYD